MLKSCECKSGGSPDFPHNASSSRTPLSWGKILALLVAIAAYAGSSPGPAPRVPASRSPPRADDKYPLLTQRHSALPTPSASRDSAIPALIARDAYAQSTPAMGDQARGRRLPSSCVNCRRRKIKVRRCENALVCPCRVRAAVPVDNSRISKVREAYVQILPAVRAAGLGLRGHR